jgi:hypothetical protein
MRRVRRLPRDDDSEVSRDAVAWLWQGMGRSLLRRHLPYHRIGDDPVTIVFSPHISQLLLGRLPERRYWSRSAATDAVQAWMAALMAPRPPMARGAWDA